MKKVSGFFVLFMLIAGFFSCDLFLKKTVQIDHVGWVLENIDTDYWSITPPDATAFLSLQVVFTGESLLASDIASVTVTDPSGRQYPYTNTAIASHFNSTSQIFECKRLWTSYYADHGSVLSIGTYSITVLLSNGNSDTMTREVFAPGTSVSSGINRVYSEEYLTIDNTPASNYAALPARATDISAVRAAGNASMTVQFSVNDSDIYSGYIWLYDSEGAYIGRTEYFRDFTTGLISSIMNNGAALYTNATLNTVHFEKDDTTLETAVNLDSVSKVIVVLTDGQQYSGSASTFDCRSLTQRVAVTQE